MRLNLNNALETGHFSRTRQRQLLLDIIQNTDGHVDARELLRLAAERDNSISHATVYRTLSLFKRLGLRDGTRFGKAQCYYEAVRGSGHQHLVCKSCGKVIDFNCPLQEMVAKVKKEQGFTVTKAEIYLEGYCSECNKKEEKKE